MRYRIETGVLRIVAVLTICPTALFGQTTTSRESSNIAFLSPGESMEQRVRQAAHVVPSERQWDWQRLEFIGFIHFGMNTFTQSEWGDGQANPARFNPKSLDANQWVRIAKAAGMKMLILTTKHHDGFCLWPSRYTSYSVRKSPWKKGKGDVVRELADACRRGGLKFGVYLSPWDRHDPSYGDSPRYNEHFRQQLRELLTNYGDITEVWFDGANGEGPNGKKQVYDWPSYYRLIRTLQPHAVIAIMGPDVRWVGTESGNGRETEWSVLPGDAVNLDSIPAHSQQTALDAAFAPRNLMGEDLGSRSQLRHARTLIWYPAEADVSIRPRWFYHADDDKHVKSPAELVDLYYSSVGRNSVLLLNIPPDADGRIARADSAALIGMRRILNRTFSHNLVAAARCTASTKRSGHDGRLTLDGNMDSYWIAGEGMDTATLEFALPAKVRVNCAMLQEQIRVGQRIEQFHIDGWNGDSWKQCAVGTTVGSKRLLRFDPVDAARFRLVITGSRGSPTLSTFGLFHSPPGSP